VTLVRPLIGIVSDFQVINDQERFSCEAPPARAIVWAAAAIPVLIHPLAKELDVEGLLQRLHGLMVAGGLSKRRSDPIRASRYSRQGPYDRIRDAISLPLIQAALRRGYQL